MSIPKQTRAEYEQGRRDAEKGTVDQFITDVFQNHRDSSAYYKGRRGEQLDRDKNEEEEADYWP